MDVDRSGSFRTHFSDFADCDFRVEKEAAQAERLGQPTCVRQHAPGERQQAALTTSEAQRQQHPENRVILPEPAHPRREQEIRAQLATVTK